MQRSTRRFGLASVVAAAVLVAAGCGGTPTSKGKSSTGGPTGHAAAARSLPAGSQVVTDLTEAWVRAQAVRVANVAGGKPRSVKYAVVTSTGMHWAIADFAPSKATLDGATTPAGEHAATQFQDGPWILRQPKGGQWRMVTDTGGFPCRSQLPAALATLWRLPACH